MPTGTATTSDINTTAATTADNKNVSEPSLIHNKIITTRKNYVLVLNSRVGVCAGRRVREVPGTGSAKKYPCTTVVTVTFVIVVQATHLPLHRAWYGGVTRCRVGERIHTNDVDTLR